MITLKTRDREPRIDRLRRLPKGRRQKSGPWWKRHPLNLPIVDDSFAEHIWGINYREEPRPPVKGIEELRLELAIYGEACIEIPAGRTASATDTALMKAIQAAKAAGITTP